MDAALPLFRGTEDEALAFLDAIRQNCCGRPGHCGVKAGCELSALWLDQHYLDWVLWLRRTRRVLFQDDLEAA